MLHQLTSDQFHRVQSLFAELSTDHLFCAGVISGRYDGTIVVDNLDQPRSAMVFRPGTWAYFGGDAANKPFLEALGAALLERQFVGTKTWGLLCTVNSAEWEAALHALLPNRQPIATPRHLFIGTSDHFNPPPNLPEGYTLRFIDDTLADSVTTDLPNDVQSVLKLRQGQSDPDRHAFGFVALHNHQCVAWSMIDAIIGNHGDIGLVTEEAYRRRGLARAVSGATIQYGLSHSISHIHWDVHSGNLASIGLAHKHGLKLKSTYNQNLLIFGEVSYLANQAWNRLDDGDFDKTIAFCEQLLTIEGGQLYGNFLYGAALAGQGKLDAAFSHLHRAIDHGMHDRFEWQMCQPLHALHGTSEWDALMARLPS